MAIQSLDRVKAAFYRRAFAVMVSLAFLLGFILRVHLLRDQVLLDDEWHTLSFVMDRALAGVLTQFSVPSGFTSIPLNLYAWLLLRSAGWSELILRLPSLVLGLACLLLGPLLAAPLIGRRASGMFALFIAVSPLLVFYSRLARPYSVVACLGFLSIIAAARWLQTGKLRHGVAYAICGLLSVYGHPFAAITIGTMGASVWVAAIVQAVRSERDTHAVLSWIQVTGVLAGAAVAGTALMLPALLDSFQSSMGDVARQSSPELASWGQLTTLFCGSANIPLCMLLVALAITGLVRLVRTHRALGITVAIMFPLQALALIAMGPHSSHVGIVLARYSIILLPVFLMLAAQGLDAALDALSHRTPLPSAVQTLIAAIVILVLLLTGPLPRTWHAPNNFINHGIYQHDYRNIDWSLSFASEFAPKDYPIETRIRTQELSGFYGFLREHPGRRPVVEYPTMIGDHFNPHYFSQWYHQRPALLGYAIGLIPPAPLPGGGVYGNTYIDDVLNLVANPSALHFRNHISMTDFDGMRLRNVEYIVVHKRFEAEFPKLALPPASMSPLLKQYRDSCHIVFEDGFILVFSLDSIPPLVPPPNPPRK
ncbi:MAG: hypothetical protein O3C57_01910, partial [Verrucomicrobia bacterium]|nr:hypothetical protein [Verrucomicrobiota bacterium]